jgi:hypothetical protein
MELRHEGSSDKIIQKKKINFKKLKKKYLTP